MDNDQSPGGEHFRDRSHWLRAVGLVEILFGALCFLCGLLFWFFTPFFRQNPATAEFARGGMLALNVLAFVAAAVLFVWLGIGTMRARRWSRDLMLVAAWVWLIVGACALIFAFLALPDRIREMSGVTPGSGEIVVVMATLGVVLGLPYLVLPGLLVLFYSGKNVRATFANRDPSPRWTGKCPLSVLTLCQILACCAFASPFSAVYIDALPVGGLVVSGVAAKLIFAAFTVLYCYLTWAVYKLKVHAWWINLLVTLLSFAWFAVDYRSPGLEELASKSGFSSGVDGRIPGQLMSGLIALMGVGYLVFLFLIKKHFRGKTRIAELEGK